MDECCDENYQERVVAEQADLLAKIEKLNCFIEDQINVAQTLHSDDIELLTVQCRIMEAYNSILSARIIRFKR